MLLLLAAVALTFPADVVFVNGNIYTVNDRRPKAQAVAIKNARFLYVGSNAGARAFEGKGTKLVDLHGASVYPGFADSHFHIEGVGERELTFNLEGVPSLQEFKRRVAQEVEKAKPGEWVAGRGWIETFWKPQAFPTRYDLDEVSPHNPVYLVRADGHAGVANSAALRLAKITKDTPEPRGGKINRDENGEPTGMLLDHAQALVGAKIRTAVIPVEQALEKGSQFALEHGLCEVQVAGMYWPEADAARKLEESGRLKVRLYAAIYGPGPAADRLIAHGPSIGDHFTVRDIKIVFDGALGSRGAALLQPFSDYDTSGYFTADPKLMEPMMERALKAGIQVETHAIGDRANRTILDLYEQAFGAVTPEHRKVREPRWRVEHAQIVSPVDIPRFGKLHVIASMQPSHAIGDLYFAPKRLGYDRLKGAYAWRSLIAGGAIVAAGSDAPVERGDPRIEFYAASQRKDLKGGSGEGWHPEEAVDRATALKMITLWPAYAAFEETKKGSIEVGKLADMTVLGGDIMTEAPLKIPETPILMTVIGGEIVYRAK